MEIAAEITAVRKEKALSLRQMAQATGLSHQTIANVERGVPASTRVYLRIARALGIADDRVQMLLENELERRLQVPLSAEVGGRHMPDKAHARVLDTLREKYQQSQRLTPIGAAV